MKAIVKAGAILFVMVAFTALMAAAVAGQEREDEAGVGTMAAGEQLVLVALVDDLRLEEFGAAGASALVIRRPVDLPTDVILVTERTRPPDLAKAFEMLFRARREFGVEVEQEMRAPITPARAVVTDGRNVSESARVLAELARTQPEEIDGIGLVPVVPVPTLLPGGRD